MSSPNGSFKGMPIGSALGLPTGYNDGGALRSDEDIILGFTDVGVLGSTLRLDDGVTFGVDYGSELGSSAASFNDSNDGKPVGSLLGISLG